jgi:hypothetical protein
LLTVASIVSPSDQLTSVFVLDTSNPTPSAQWVLTVTIVRGGTTIWEGSTTFDPTQYRKLSRILQNPLGSSQINSVNCSIATCVQICECSLLPLDSFDRKLTSQAMLEIEVQNGAKWNWGDTIWSNIIIEAEATGGSWCNPYVLFPFSHYAFGLCSQEIGSLRITIMPPEARRVFLKLFGCRTGT